MGLYEYIDIGIYIYIYIYIFFYTFVFNLLAFMDTYTLYTH
jgi:hypothetical protein